VQQVWCLVKWLIGFLPGQFSTVILPGSLDPPWLTCGAFPFVNPLTSLPSTILCYTMSLAAAPSLARGPELLPSRPQRPVWNDSLAGFSLVLPFGCTLGESPGLAPRFSGGVPVLGPSSFDSGSPAVLPHLSRCEGSSLEATPPSNPRLSPGLGEAQASLS
jgi:hypothetical protein